MEEKIKKTKPKMSKIELIFRIFSIVFLVGFTIFYAVRFIHFYKIYHPKTETGEKTELIGVTIRKDKPVVYEGSGLYSDSGSFVFKGEVDNNYVRYSNLLWRIIRINQDNSIVLVSDDYVNNLVWNYNDTNYSSSNIRDWLIDNGEHTGIFEKSLNNPEKYLQPNTVCLDIVAKLEDFACNEKSYSDNVTLLNVSEYLNSMNENTTYIKGSKNIWLSTAVDDKNAWHISNDSVSKSAITNGYAVKPVITLKKTNVIQGGNGSLNDPYTIEEEKEELTTYSYVKLGSDIWRVYETNDSYVRLILDGYYGGTYNTYSYNPSGNKFNVNVEYSLAKYLNTTLYDTLSYKDSLIDCDWYTGEYTDESKFDYKRVYTDKVTAKVGLYNVADVKLDSSISNYFFMTPASANQVYSFNNDENLFSSKPTYVKKIRPAICIKNEKITKGNGTKNSPYEMGE